MINHSKPIISTVALAAVLMLFPGRILAGPLTLDEAVRRALDGSPRLQADRAEARSGDQAATSAAWERWPRLQMDVGAHRTDDPVAVFGDLLRQGRFTAEDFGTLDPAAGTFDLTQINHHSPEWNLSAGLTVVQPLWTGGATTSRIHAGRAQAEAAAAMAERSAQEVAFDTERAFRQALLADERASLLRETLAVARGQAARIESLWTVGLALQSDRQAMNAHAQEARAGLIAALADSMEARSILGLMMGAGGPVTDSLLVPSSTIGTPAPAMDLEDALSGAGGRADVRASEAGRRAAEAERGASRAAVFPSINLAASIRHDRPSFEEGGEEHWMVGLNLQWVLGGGSFSRNASTGSRAEAAAYRERAALEHAEHEIRTTYSKWSAAVLRNQAMESAMESAGTAYALVQKRHEEGLATTLELTESQNTWTRTRLEAAKSRHDAALAQRAYELASGTMELPEDSR